MTSYHLPPPASPYATGGRPAQDTTGGAPAQDATAGHRVRRVRVLAITTSVAGMVLTGVLVWALLPDSGSDSDAGGTSGAGAPTSSVSAIASKSAAASPAADGPAATVNLLTAEGLRTTVEKLTAAMGGSKVTDLTVYGDYAIAEAPVKGHPKLYDRYRYDGGDVAVKDGPGGSVMSGDTAVDLSLFNWDAVPTLFAKADRTLNVPSPKLRYLVINPASTIFDTEPNMAVYLSDDYGAGYLSATPKGKVIDTYPHD